VLVEGAWSYRFPARVTSPIQVRLESAPERVRATVPVHGFETPICAYAATDIGLI
jgi:hypothetical protein